MLALRDGAAEGRLTSDELAQRAELAYRAVTRGGRERDLRVGTRAATRWLEVRVKRAGAR